MPDESWKGMMPGDLIQLRSDYDICECGDYRHNHEDKTGRCKVCSWQKSLPDTEVCKEFRLQQRACPECHGQTVFFRGHGWNSEYRLCHRWTKPGHKDELQIKAEIEKIRLQEKPSGRMA
jgi:hypothetical protein